MKTFAAIAIVLSMSVPALAGHGGCGCGQPAGCASCEGAAPDCGCQKRFHLPKICLHDLDLLGIFKCKKCCSQAETCSTCEPAPCAEPAPCGCQKKCGHFKLMNLFKHKSCGCDACGCGCDAGATGEIAPPEAMEGVPEVPPPPAPHEEDVAPGKAASRGYQRTQLAPQLYREDHIRAQRQINSQPIRQSSDFEVNQPSTRNIRSQWPVR